MKKSNSVMTHTTDLAKGITTILVVGFEKQPIIVDSRKWAGEAYDKLTDHGKIALCHGDTQRVSDRAAIQRDRTTGQSATPAEKHGAMQSLVTHYDNGGEWDLHGDGLKPIDRAALYQAVAKVRGATPEQVEAIYRSKEDAVIRTLLTIGAVAAEYTRLTARTESDKAKELLAELDKMTAGPTKAEMVDALVKFYADEADPDASPEEDRKGWEDLSDEDLKAEWDEMQAELQKKTGTEGQ